MKNSLAVILTFLFVLTSCLSGCTSHELNTEKPYSEVTNLEATEQEKIIVDAESSEKKIESQAPTYIGNFRVQDNDRELEIIFSLYDPSKAYMSSNGYVSIRIESNNGKTLYLDNHRVLESDFSTFTQTLTGEQFEAYSWKIPLSEINKSESWSGMAYIQFKSENGIIFEELSTSVFGLPEYSKDELDIISSLEFSKNAVVINKTIKQDGLEVTLKQIGFFIKNEYDTKTTYYRADFIVYNYGREASRISSYNGYLIHNKSQYDRSYNSNLDVYDLKTGIQREGYLLFDNVPSNLAGEIIISAGSAYDRNYNNIDYTFRINLDDYTTK